MRFDDLDKAHRAAAAFKDAERRLEEAKRITHFKLFGGTDRACAHNMAEVSTDQTMYSREFADKIKSALIEYAHGHLLLAKGELEKLGVDTSGHGG